MSSVYLVLYVEKIFDYILFFTFWYAEPVGLALDLECYHPSVLLNCWLGHLTYKIISEMTYNVSSGMLNPTIPYHTIPYHDGSQLSCCDKFPNCLFV